MQVLNRADNHRRERFFFASLVMVVLYNKVDWVQMPFQKHIIDYEGAKNERAENKNEPKEINIEYAKLKHGNSRIYQNALIRIALLASAM